jgi:hypothetical protein
MTIDTTNHAVTTSTIQVQFGNSTTNTPNDPERIDSLKWVDSSGKQTQNLAASGGSSCSDRREWWGEAYGATEGQGPFLVVGGSTGTWSSPAPNQVRIQSESSSNASCFTSQIPVTTTYTFFDSGPQANQIKVERTVPFDQHPYGNSQQQGLRVYVPRPLVTTFSQVLYPDASGAVTASHVCDNCAPLDSSQWAGGWFADNNPIDNSGVVVLRDPADQPGAQLEIDEDIASGSNNTAIDLPQPPGGWSSPVDEVEYLCFYDATSWPVADRQAGHPAILPAGCGPQAASASTPTVSAERVLAASSASATVAANVNPHAAATRYHVEWGPSASYGSSGPDLPADTPLTGDSDQSVGAQLTGLAPASTYHWRIVATNAVGTAAGADQTVTTPSAGSGGSGGGGSGGGGTGVGQPPTAVLSTTPAAFAGARTIVSAAGSSGNGSRIVSYGWDWTGTGNYSGTCGAGNPVAMPVYTHTGTYHVGLRVMTASGQTSNTSSTVTVSHVPTGQTPGAGAVHGYTCGSIVGNALCVHHIEWDLIVADALDNGCFDEVTVIPMPIARCGVACAPDAGGAADRRRAAAEPITGVPPGVAGALHKTNAKTWKTTGRVLVNGVIISPQTHVFRRATKPYVGVVQPMVLINEVDDAIYSPYADVSVEPPSSGNLPDTVLRLAHDQPVFTTLPFSVATPAALSGLFGGARDRAAGRLQGPHENARRTQRALARAQAPLARAGDAADTSNPCEDTGVQALPALGTFDPASAGLGAKIDDFPLSGPVTVHLINGRMIGCVDIELPSFLPCGSGSFLLKATLVADQSGLSLQDLHARMPCAIVAGVLFKNVFFNYVAADQDWAAGGDVEAIPGLGMDGSVEFSHGDFVHAHAQLDTEPLLFGPMQLRDVGIDVFPDHTSGHLAVNLFPNIPGINVSPLDVVGGYDLFWQANPAYFQVTGMADTFGIPFANGKIVVYDNGRIQGEGHLNASVFGAFRADADITTDFWSASPLRFNGFGSGSISVFDVVRIGGEVLVSDNGAAACAAIVGDFLGAHYHLHIGGALNWDPLRFRPMFDGCDVGVERDAPPMLSRDGVSGRVAQRGFTVPIARGTRYEIIGIDGSGAPPAVALHGPRGEHFETPLGHPVLRGRYQVLHDAGTRSTFVIVGAPGAGRWTVTALPGSSPVTAVHFATSLPAPSVAASVVRAGRRLRLSYRIGRVPGQVVRFVERGPRSLAPIGTVRGGGHGTLRFAPASGPAGRRAVVAIVEQDGRPRAEIVVAHFHVPGPARLGRPRMLRAARRGTSLVMSWHGVDGARAYALTIVTSDRRRVTTVVRTGRFTLFDVAPSTTARMTVAALDPHERGPKASLTIHPAAKHRRGAPKGGSHARR